MEKLLFNSSEAAKLLGVSINYLTRLVKDRELNGVLLPGRKQLRFTLHDIERFIQAHRVTLTEQDPVDNLRKRMKSRFSDDLITRKIKKAVQEEKEKIKNKKP